ncbi:DUF937 domain-containing protein [Mycobacteroides franklinii]|uniref:DUF937 domain-containing protein n=1 Tax=Mycobacteroides franklinii TaxID=948102 RepID=A0A1S1L962_9MYCO|nr:DUF937 domain-containing protein [Mycobacteroides franklinii]OHU30569.1 hypothetical protein BKG76_02110 [Mycobacteroides franklinii]ORA63580.1 hypothetical protein BST24_04295 [Mycobacteroides franklinii]TDH19502.1 DUF937 domain-containing protein [Mycobacteroides franklinii]TDZ42248.1 hypothetical protein CCUG64054_02292 [Mycobacteroides franklinii]TDZ52396.1 hypothetical protein CCUG63697_00877 [Mycobacteroides franklinii]
MATLDELLNEIPTEQIAAKLGVDNETADKAIKSVVPLLVGGLQANADDPDKAADLQANVNNAPSTLLDGGVNVEDVDQHAGNAVVASLFGDNNADDVAAKLAGAGAGNSDLIKQLLPILTPIVLAFVAKKLTGGGAAAAPAEAPAASGGIGDILGNILGSAVGGGAAAGGNNPLGSILGSVLGSKGGSDALGSILGGLLGGKK